MLTLTPEIYNHLRSLGVEFEITATFPKGMLQSTALLEGNKMLPGMITCTPDDTDTKRFVMRFVPGNHQTLEVK